MNNHRMETEILKAEVLIEAIPYIRRFAGSTVVVKYGGSAMVDEKLKRSVIQDIAMLKYIGLKPVVVHGGGKEITSLLERLGKQSQFLDGLRVTDEETAKVAEMVLSGSIGKALVDELQMVGISSVGISGKDGRSLLCSRKLDEKGRDLGFVGQIDHVDTTLLETLLANNFVPVVSPVGVDAAGNTYNINADYAASAVAGSLSAQKLIFLTDVEGILKDKDDPSTILRTLSEQEALGYIADGTIKGGMIPKVQCCLDGLDKGVESVHVLDGRVPHAILLEIFTTKGVGTMVTKEKQA
ncbi:MAG: acetylglutamate kinase [Sphaerochaeta sp.]|nr:acetylglutamate kinase [Sphaerochaeta sp.]